MTMALVMIYASCVVAMADDNKPKKSKAVRYWVVDGVRYDAKLDAILKAIEGKTPSVVECTQKPVEKLVK